jgi:hypothetical protein
LHYSPSVSGYSFLPTPVATIVGTLLAQRALRHMNPRNLLLVGSALMATGVLFLVGINTGDSVYFTRVLPALLINGVGFGLNAVAVSVAGSHGFGPKEAGTASGVMSTSQETGAAFGVAVIGSIAAGGTLAAFRAGYIGVLVLIILAFLVTALFIRPVAPTPS